jgi:hypothetical protein
LCCVLRTRPIPSATLPSSRVPPRRDRTTTTTHAPVRAASTAGFSKMRLVYNWSGGQRKRHWASCRQAP